MILANGAEILRIKLSGRTDTFEGTVLAEYHGEFVTWWCGVPKDYTIIECYNGHYFGTDYDAAVADYNSR